MTYVRYNEVNNNVRRGYMMRLFTISSSVRKVVYAMDDLAYHLRTLNGRPPPEPFHPAISPTCVSKVSTPFLNCYDIVLVCSVRSQHERSTLHQTFLRGGHHHGVVTSVNEVLTRRIEQCVQRFRNLRVHIQMDNKWYASSSQACSLTSSKASQHPFLAMFLVM